MLFGAGMKGSHDNIGRCTDVVVGPPTWMGSRKSCFDGGGGGGDDDVWDAMGCGEERARTGQGFREGIRGVGLNILNGNFCC